MSQISIGLFQLGKFNYNIAQATEFVFLCSKYKAKNHRKRPLVFVAYVMFTAQSSWRSRMFESGQCCDCTCNLQKHYRYQFKPKTWKTVSSQKPFPPPQTKSKTVLSQWPKLHPAEKEINSMHMSFLLRPFMHQLHGVLISLLLARPSVSEFRKSQDWPK